MTKLQQELAVDFYFIYTQELCSLILKEAKIAENSYTIGYVASYLLLTKLDPKTDKEIKNLAKCIKKEFKLEIRDVTYV